MEVENNKSLQGINAKSTDLSQVINNEYYDEDFLKPESSVLLHINLTKNSCQILQGHNRYIKLPDGPSYDEMFLKQLNYVTEDYKKLYIDTFKRSQLLNMYSQGQQHRYVEFYIKASPEIWSWIGAQIFFRDSSNESDIICYVHIFDLNKIKCHLNNEKYLYEKSQKYEHKAERYKKQKDNILLSIATEHYAIYLVDLLSGNIEPLKLAKGFHNNTELGNSTWKTLTLDNIFRVDVAYRERFMASFSYEALIEAANNGREKIEQIYPRIIDDKYRYLMIEATFKKNEKGDNYVIIAFKDVDNFIRQQQEFQNILSGLGKLYNSILYLDFNLKKAQKMVDVNGTFENFDFNSDYYSNLNKYCDSYINPQYRFVVREKIRIIKDIEEKRTKGQVISVEYKNTNYPEETNLYGIKWTKCTFIPLNDEDVITRKGLLVFEDITNLKIQSEEISRETILLTQAVSNGYTVVLSVNLSKNTYHMINDNYRHDNIDPYERCYSHATSDVAKKVHPSNRELFHNTVNRNSLLSKYENGETNLYIEYQVLEQSEYHWMGLQIMLIPDPFSKDILAIILTKKIDEIRKAEEQNKLVLKNALLMAEQANKAKSDFLSRFSHDIRTPMNGIMGMAYIAQKNINDKSKVEESLNKIIVAGNQLQLLLNDVLDMSRLEKGKIEIFPESFKLKELLERLISTISVLAEQKGVILKDISYNNIHDDLIGSVTNIHRVLQNIIINAIKYNKAGGIVEITVEEQILDTKHSIFCFIIQDTGIGMSDEYQKQIFEPFSRGNSNNDKNCEGIGLGMTIAKELVDLMSGEISIASGLDSGTTLKVRLPLAIDSNEEIIEPQNTKNSIENINILLVDDNEINLEIASYMLKEKGAKVFCAKDGIEAVTMFQNSPVNAFDVILMDIMMPKMDGYAATETIRSLDREDAKTVPIIAMTANAFREDAVKCLNVGMNDHISKPIDIEKSVNIVSKYLRIKESKKMR